MDTSIFLAKVISIFAAIMAVSIIFNRNRIRTIILESSKEPAFFFATGIILSIVGALLVVSHNIWQASWTIVITLIGWLTLFRGFARLVFPEQWGSVLSKLAESKNGIYIVLVVVIAICIYLGHYGFFGPSA